ncbi:MAG: glutaredoxin family protein [Thermomicrobiales bacterium]
MTVRPHFALQGVRALAGRLRGQKAAAPVALTCYGKPECSLCDKAKTPVERAISAYGGRVTATWVNILDDEALMARWGWRIPVICAGETVLAEGKVSELRLRRALDAYLASREAGGAGDA